MLPAVFACLTLAVGLIAALRSRFRAAQLYIWFALFRPQEWLWFDVSGYRLSTVLGAPLVLPSSAADRVTAAMAVPEPAAVSAPEELAQPVYTPQRWARAR